MSNYQCFKYIFTSTALAQVMLGDGNTHNSAIECAQNLFKHNYGDRKTIKDIILSALPPGYGGDLNQDIERILPWAETHSDAPNESDSQKARMMTETKDVVLFHDSNQRGYLFTHINGAPRTLAIKSMECERLLQSRYFRSHGEPIGANPLREVLQTLEARALFEGNQQKVHVRHAFHEGSLIVDLCDVTGQAVKISPQGVEIITPQPPVHFIRPLGIMALPLPIIPGNPQALDKLNIPSKIRLAIYAFLIGCHNPRGPYPILVIEGEQGSGKTILSRLIKKLIDPFSVEVTRAPKNEEDLLIHADSNFLLGFDNLSGMSNAISDAFCRLSTGGGIITRTLYTNADPFIFENCRPVVMNGISDIATRPDLLERSIMVKMEPIDGLQRKTEEEIYQDFEKDLPTILGALYAVIAAALRNLPQIHLKELPRMADFARFITAAEEELGLKRHTFIQVLNENQIEATTTVIENYPLAEFLVELAYDAPFKGTVGKLYGKLPRDLGGMPKSTPRLSAILKRIKPALRKQGVLIEFGEKTNKGRLISITVTDEYKKNLVAWNDSEGDTPKL